MRIERSRNVALLFEDKAVVIIQDMLIKIDKLCGEYERGKHRGDDMFLQEISFFQRRVLDMANELFDDVRSGIVPVEASFRLLHQWVMASHHRAEAVFDAEERRRPDPRATLHAIAN